MSAPTFRLSSLRRHASDALLAGVLVAITAAVYLPKMAATVLIDHDDVVSVIAATCNELRNANAPELGRWASAADWQQYWHMQTFGCFGTISEGLVKTDIHPPLYFWLLHIWMNVFGVSIFAGLSLNIVFMAVAAVVIYATARTLAVSRRLAFLVTLAWLVSLSTRSVAGVIRQYSLFTMITAILLLLTILWLQRRHWSYLAGISATILAGLLTHYQFPFVVAGIGIVAAFLVWKRHDARALTQLIGAGFVGVLLFLAIHPHFRQSVLLAHAQAQPFDLKVFPLRIGASLLSVAEMFNPLDWAHPLPYGMLDWNHPGAVAITIANIAASIATFWFAVMVLRRFIRTRLADPNFELAAADVPTAAGILTLAIVIALYIAFVSPVHAIAQQYLNFITPMLFVGIAYALQNRTPALIERRPTAIAATLCVSAAVATSVFVVHQKEVLPIYEIGRADSLAIDSQHRGILGPLIWYAQPSARVYTAAQKDLLGKFPALPPRTDGELIYASSDFMENTARNRRDILKDFLQQGYSGPQQIPFGVVPLIPFGGHLYVFPKVP